MRRIIVTLATFMVICSKCIIAQNSLPKLNQVELSKKLAGAWQIQDAKDTVNGFEMSLYKNAVLETMYVTVNGVKELLGTISFYYDPVLDKFKGFWTHPDGRLDAFYMRFSASNNIVLERVDDFKTNKSIAVNKFSLADDNHLNGTHYDGNEVQQGSSKWVRTNTRK